MEFKNLGRRQPVPTNQARSHSRHHQPGPPPVVPVPHVHHQAPHAHVDGKVGPHQKGDRHRHREWDPPPVPPRHHVPHQINSDRKGEEGVAELHTVGGQRREALDPKDGHVAVDQRVGRLVDAVWVSDVERAVEEEEGQGRHNTADGGPHGLGHEHGTGGGEGEVARFKVVHQIRGYGDDGLYEATTDESRHHPVVRRAHEGGQDEEGDLPVVVGHVHVGEARPVRIAEAEGGGQHVSHKDVVPFERGKHDGDHNDGDNGE
ncbi:protein kinase family protein [Striga asiatica]|uniref:Protein kinase family protein n=1 Tax=Striga asiatica TaxID=4170 RepID=A0A5A7P7C5_STRAF|nr:protein kinase family protein [Striga asiatica]